MNRKIVFEGYGFGLCIVILFFFGSIAAGAPQSSPQPNDSQKAWVAPDPATIPDGPMGDSIRLGLKLFDETPKYAPSYVGNKMSCSHCHAESGTAPFAIPMVGIPGLFPMYRDREKEVVTFEERIEQCFQRSEFGHRVPNNNPTMVALVAYAQWLSKDQPTGKALTGRGLVKLPDLTGDVERGSQIYTKQCALCHGAEGKGQLPDIPALWGPDAFSDGAGMNNIDRMAAFVQHNMPQTKPGSLTSQEAFDVAAYVHSKPHEHFDIKDHQ